MQFHSGSGYLKSHNNLDLEIKLMLPLKPDFSGTTYVPTSSSTRRVNSCIRGTCKAWTEQLFIISMIRAYTDFHTYALGVLFKAWNFFLCFNLFCFYFILYFYPFLRFWMIKLTIFLDIRRMDMSDDLPGYMGTPKLEWSLVGLPSWPIFFVCSVKFKHAMMWKGKLCKKINYPICKCKNG